MRSISENDKKIWLSDLSHKSYELSISDGSNVRIILNSGIKEECIEITEAMEDSAQLTFSGCRAKQLKVVVQYIEEDIVGQSITLKAKAELYNDETEEMVLFSGKVSEVTQNGNEDIVSTIVARDAMADVNTIDVAEWYSTLEFPTTMQDFADSLAEHLETIGMVLNCDDLPLGAVSIDETIAPQNLALNDVLIAIATLNGMYCVCDVSNEIGFKELTKLEASGLYPDSNLYPSDTLYPEDYSDNAEEHIATKTYKSITYQNYDVATIDKVIIREDYDDIGAIHGTGTNAYIIEGNFLMYGKSAADLAEVAEAVYSRVNGYIYTPAKITCSARPWIECGDLVRVYSDENVIYSYVLEKTFKGVQTIEDVYQSKQDALRVEQNNSLNTQIIQLRGKANRLTRDIEHLSSEIYNEDGSSKIEQNAEAIELKVSASDVCSVISQSADSISLSANRITITSDNFMLNPEGQEIAHLDVVMKVGQIQNEYQNAFLLTKGGDIYARSMYVGLNTITTNGITALAISCSTTLSVTGAISGGSTISANGAISGGSITVVGEAKANTVSCNNLNIGATGYSAKTLTWTPIYGSNGYTVVAYGLSPYSASKPTSVLGT